MEVTLEICNARVFFAIGQITAREIVRFYFRSTCSLSFSRQNNCKQAGENVIVCTGSGIGALSNLGALHPIQICHQVIIKRY